MVTFLKASNKPQFKRLCNAKEQYECINVPGSYNIEVANLEQNNNWTLTSNEQFSGSSGGGAS